MIWAAKMTNSSPMFEFLEESGSRYPWIVRQKCSSIEVLVYQPNLWGPNTKKYKTATREKILHLGTQQIWRNDQETTPQGKRILLNYSFSFCISMFFFRPPCFCWGSPLHFIYMVVVFSWKERCLFSIQFQGAAPVTKWKVFVYSHLPRDQIHTM